MVAGPEQARLLTEFESQFMEEEDYETFQQHEQGLASQALFIQNACKHVVKQCLSWVIHLKTRRSVEHCAPLMVPG